MTFLRNHTDEKFNGLTDLPFQRQKAEALHIFFTVSHAVQLSINMSKHEPGPCRNPEISLG